MSRLSPPQDNFPVIQFDEKLFRNIFDNAFDGLLLTDRAGRFLAANPIACKILDTTHDTILGKTIHDFAHEEYEFDSSEHSRHEFQLLARDGLLKIIEFTIAPDLLPNLHLFVLRDLTEIRLEFVARLRSEERFRFLSEAGSILASSLDTQEIVGKIAELTILTLADLCLVHLLSPSGDLENIKVAARDPQKNEKLVQMAQILWTAKVKNTYKTALESQKPQMKIEFTDTDYIQTYSEPEHIALLQEIHPRSIIVAPLIGNKQVLGTLSVARQSTTRPYDLRDLELFSETARRVALTLENIRIHQNSILVGLKNAELYEDSLVTLEQLKTERTLREQFVSTLTHDLRTPLTAARMAAQLIIKTPHDPEHIAKYSSKVIEDIDRVDRMIRDLLDANQIRAGQKLPLRVTACDLTALSIDILDELAAFYGNRFILQNTSSIRGFWDVQALQRVIENLCNNAVKYGFSDTPITLSLVEHGENVQISVHNEGQPISPSAQSKLFDYFHRIQDTAQNEQKGWGIGLTLVRGVAEAHGGSVRVVSEIGHGTTFIIDLPLDARHHQP